MSAQKPARLRLEHLITLDPLTKSQEEVFTSWKEGPFAGKIF